jgi:hypothetical protein
MRCFFAVATHGGGGTPSRPRPATEQSPSRYPPAILVAMLEAVHETAETARLQAEEKHRFLTEKNEQLVQENLKLRRTLEGLESTVKEIHDVTGSAISGFISME